MIKLILGPVGQLVVCVAFMIVYCELRVTDTVPDEPIGWALCFFSGMAITILTPRACQQFAAWKKQSQGKEQ